MVFDKKAEKSLKNVLYYRVYLNEIQKVSFVTAILCLKVNVKC